MHICLLCRFVHLSKFAFVCMSVFASSLFTCPPEEGVSSYLWPLQVQGWHVITKTALSITLTDRLKRGFNSYSSPWALHHRGRYPSTPLLSPFIVSSCQSLSGLTKWPLLLLRSAAVFSLILWLWVREVQQQQEEPYHWTEGLALCLSPGDCSMHHTQGAWWRFYEEVGLRNHIHAHHVLLMQPLSSVSVDCPSFLWVALSNPITTCVSVVSKQPGLKAPPPRHHPFQPGSSWACGL